MAKTSNMDDSITPSISLVTCFVVGAVAGYSVPLASGPWMKEAFGTALHLGADLALFVSASTALERCSADLRKKKDPWNSVMAVALSRGLLDLKGGSTLRSAAFSAVGMGIIAVPLFWGPSKVLEKMKQISKSL